jgi:hypothetical protein
LSSPTSPDPNLGAQQHVDPHELQVKKLFFGSLIQKKNIDAHVILEQKIFSGISEIPCFFVKGNMVPGKILKKFKSLNF